MTDKATDVTVEPCPFCGGYDLAVSATLAGGISWHMVECNNQECDIGGPPCRSEAEAIAAWNRRTAQAEIVEALERIDKMMRELRAIKSRPIANSGFSTGPALHFDQARRIALDARREVRATLSKYRTDGGV